MDSKISTASTRLLLNMALLGFELYEDLPVLNTRGVLSRRACGNSAVVYIPVPYVLKLGYLGLSGAAVV